MGAELVMSTVVFVALVTVIAVTLMVLIVTACHQFCYYKYALQRTA